MAAPDAIEQQRHHNRAAGRAVDGFVCWLVIPAVFGLLLSPAFHRNLLQALSVIPSQGLDFVLVWAVAVAVATLVYGRFRGYTPAGALFLTLMAVVLLPLVIIIFLVTAFASNVGG